MERTNAQRAQLAAAILDEYETRLNDQSGLQSADESMTDLLSDLLHFCQREGVSFDACLTSAVLHFECEAAA